MHFEFTPAIEGFTIIHHRQPVDTLEISMANTLHCLFIYPRDDPAVSFGLDFTSRSRERESTTKTGVMAGSYS